MGKTITVPVIEFGAGNLVNRDQDLNLDLIKAVVLDENKVNHINYRSPSGQANIIISTSLTIAELQDLADASGYDHGLVFVLIVSFDGNTVGYPKYGLINEKAVVNRVEKADSWHTDIWMDFGDEDHADQKPLEVIYLDEGYAGVYGYDTGEGASAEVTAELTTSPCWAASATKNYNVLVDRGGFTGTLYVEVTANNNFDAVNASLANPAVNANLAVPMTAGPYSTHVVDGLQVIIRDTDASGEILYSFRTAIPECVT